MGGSAAESRAQNHGALRGRGADWLWLCQNPLLGDSLRPTMSCSLSPDTGGLESLLQDIKVALSEAQAVRGDAKELQIVAQRLVDEMTAKRGSTGDDSRTSGSSRAVDEQGNAIADEAEATKSPGEMLDEVAQEQAGDVTLPDQGMAADAKEAETVVDRAAEEQAGDVTLPDQGMAADAKEAETVVDGAAEEQAGAVLFNVSEDDTTGDVAQPDQGTAADTNEAVNEQSSDLAQPNQGMAADATTEADNALDGAAQQPADDAMLPDQGRPDEAETVMDEAESEQVGDVEQLETGSEEANAQASECEWVQCYDETSHSNYYFNQITQATQWEAPEVYTKLPWEEQLDEGSGRMYYVNAMTGITQWEIPNEGFALYHAEIEESPLPEVAEQDECEDNGWQPVNAGSGATETEGSGCEIPDGSQLGVEDHVAEGETAELVNEDAEPSTVDAKTTEPANADADTVESDNAASLDLRDSSESQPADIDTADTPEAENSANRKAAAEQKKQQRLEATKERKRRAKEKLYGRNRPSIEEEAEHRSKVGMEPNRAGTSILSDPYAFQPPPPSPPLEESSPRSTMITKSPRGKDRASKERSPRLAGLSGQYVDHMTGQTVSQSTTVNESSGPQDPQSNIKMLDLSMFSLMDKKEEDENVDK